MATTSPDQEFEAALLAADTAISGSLKRLRETRGRTAQLLKKPTSDRFPFNDEIDVLNASLEAVQAVTGTLAPNFDLKSDPRCVFVNVRDTIIAYGDECRQEGRSLERTNSEPRVRPELGLEMLKCISHLNSMLSDGRAV